MAIRRNKVDPPKDVPEDVTPEDVQEQEDPSVEETTKEVATQPAASAPVVSSVKVPSIAELENALDARDFGNLFPRIVGSGGGLVCKKDKKSTQLGESIDVQVVSVSNRYMITPDAEMSDAKARKLCRASYDGKVIPGWDGNPDITIEEWEQEIMEAGYDVKPLSSYKDIFCSIFNAGKNMDYAQEVGLVQVSVSPTAIKSLRAFTVQIPMMVARGIMLDSHKNCFRIGAVAVTGDRDYTVLDFSPTPIEVLSTYTPVV